MKAALKKEKGFTLIELLVVIGIIGILAAIAIPQFASYRKKGFDARARSDLKNAATAEEALYADTEAYADCANAACEASLPGFKLSPGVEISMTGAGNSFTGQANHPQGENTFNWDSANGGLQ